MKVDTLRWPNWSKIKKLYELVAPLAPVHGILVYRGTQLGIIEADHGKKQNSNLGMSNSNS